MSLKVAIAGGGTGGHLFPALAVAEELKSHGVAQIEFFGTAFGPEAYILPRRGFTLNKIWIKGYPRKPKPEIFLLPLKVAVSVFQCIAALLRFKPDILLATGGYVCLPFMFAGKLLRLPLVIHEQNSLPGVTTKIGARWADAIFYSFEQTRSYFLKHPDCHLSGNPVRSGLGKIPRMQALNQLDLERLDRRTILVFGGSQGARSLNQAVAEVLPQITWRYNLIWQTGDGNHPGAVPKNAVIYEFIEDMGLVYSAADLALCRAGAMTLAELAAAALPAILVPFPFAAEDHQRINAEPIAESGAAEMALDRDFNGKKLLEMVDNIFSQPGKLSEMSTAMERFHHPQAAEMIAEKVMEVARRKRR